MGKTVTLSEERIRVVVADATRMNCELIVGALKRSRSNFDVQPLTGNTANAFRALQNIRPDIAVISAQMEDGHLSGFKVLYQLRASQAKTRAVMLLDCPDRDLVIESFRAGARGVFCRGHSFNSFPKCIRRVHEGQIWAGGSELEHIFELVASLNPLEIRSTDGMTLLTAREREVVRLVAEGMRNQEISEKLNLREHTVRNYLFRIFDKLGISSRVELVLYAVSGCEQKPAPPYSTSESSTLMVRQKA